MLDDFDPDARPSMLIGLMAAALSGCITGMVALGVVLFLAWRF